MNINNNEIENIQSIIREAQTLIHTDQRKCSELLEESVWELNQIEIKHNRTMEKMLEKKKKKVAEKGLK